MLLLSLEFKILNYFSKIFPKNFQMLRNCFQRIWSRFINFSQQKEKIFGNPVNCLNQHLNRLNCDFPENLIKILNWILYDLVGNIRKWLWKPFARYCVKALKRRYNKIQSSGFCFCCEGFQSRNIIEKFWKKNIPDNKRLLINKISIKFICSEGPTKSSILINSN